MASAVPFFFFILLKLDMYNKNFYLKTKNLIVHISISVIFVRKYIV